jgi:hypothetical protein
VATLRNLNFKILRMQDIKLAQMRPGAKISALSTPFDRTPIAQIPFDQKYVWLNCRLTEGCLTVNSFYRKKVICPKTKFIKYLENDHLTENLIWTTRFLSVICGYLQLKQLFRRHKKQFSDLFLELDNKFMIGICSNTCDTHLLLYFWQKLCRKLLKICS